MSSSGQIEYITFHVDDQLLGIPVHEVREVIPEQPVAKVPLAPESVAGLLNLRGQIVTAIDVRRRLGLLPREAGLTRMNIVVGDDGELFSLLVDSVGDVKMVERSSFAPTPPTLAETWRKCCGGVYRLARGLLVVIDVAALVDLENPSINTNER